MTNAKKFVNLFLTFFFNIKIKKIFILKKITNKFLIEICKINKNLNVFMRFKLRLIHDNINLHKVYFDFIFIY